MPHCLWWLSLQPGWCTYRACLLPARVTHPCLRVPALVCCLHVAHSTSLSKLCPLYSLFAFTNAPPCVRVRVLLWPAVLEFGEVEWLHPGFHNAKFIFPPGFKAQRYASEALL